MSGMTRSTPRSSDSGNIMPASMTMISSPSRSAIMFMPNSPRPPRGIAVRDCEDLLNDASTPGRKRESYHSGVDHQSPRLKACAMATRITAPSVAAASEYKKPPPKIPSLVKIQPPRYEPISPRIMSVTQPKPRPRAIFPASHPAISPRRSHETILCDSNQTLTVLCVITCSASIRPPSRTRIVYEFEVQASKGMLERKSVLGRTWLLLGHAMNCAEAQHQITACNADDFAVWEQAGKNVYSGAVVRIVEGWNQHDFVG